MPDRNDAPSKEEVEDLVRRAQQGHSEAFAGLYEAYYDKIYRYVMFKTGDTLEAEDLTEEVFLRMLESIGSFKWQGYPFTSWLFRIAHNLVIDYYRKAGRQKKTSLDDAMRVVGSDGVDVDRKLDIELSIKEVKDAMGGLTQLQQEVLSLRFAGGLSVAETAEAMGKKENAVKALQHAAIKKLRTLLGPAMEQGLISQGGA
ncbi:MAG: sigma-70 family RNA polymerase sigma factor [Dehalococcoidia bacterium]|jgi:RNA polymerase sigma-70 factor (ECF subfamily)|nr:sigma-70 family RNA polymerase sigma factor [Chloroflexota bacterium]MDE2824237.1 sigma-70 family RNA polymerase sigma factor [Chloroflexota bacterium]MXY44026.1 sigma-70 family RNA polymerase sigma factor [Dehalococcoidia bacterium]MYB48700.1 sigma-70 family RNA polymerase sigma factor [Dehalococcoidia bacterium]MYD52589.1 sigma-70 family RNA polymerase sigma factor [Dehalococcoidia bacterium]